MPPDAALPLAPTFLNPDSDGAAASDEDRQLVRDYRSQGYVVLDLGEPDFDALAESIIQSLASRYPEQDRRIDEAWFDEPGVRALAAHPRVLEVLQLLYGRRPIPFQTLNFDTGTEQAAHSDTVHFHCRPERFMAGGWVALEDIDGDNGPLVVYPGSHQLKIETMASLGLEGKASEYPKYERAIAELIEREGLRGHEVHMKRGQLLIWSANLLHGGTAIRDAKRTRHSQVTHYYFEDCAYHVPLASSPENGRYTHREVVDIGRSEYVRHRVNGKELRLSRKRAVQRYPRPLPADIHEPRDLLRKPLRLCFQLMNALGL